jgi:glucitol operon activator protein
MSGRTVFTKFRRHEEFEGIPLDQPRSNPAVLGEGEAGVAEAVKRAIEQIDRARSEPGRQPGLSGLNVARA